MCGVRAILVERRRSSGCVENAYTVVKFAAESDIKLGLRQRTDLGIVS